MLVEGFSGLGLWVMIRVGVRARVRVRVGITSDFASVLRRYTCRLERVD